MSKIKNYQTSNSKLKNKQTSIRKAQIFPNFSNPRINRTVWFKKILRFKKVLGFSNSRVYLL